MRGYNKWNYRPYIPLDRNDSFVSPYICRVAPSETSVLIEWLDNSESETHTLYYKERTEEKYENSLELTDKKIVISGLKPDTEYELYIENKDGYKSDVRIAKTGFVPGQVINYLHPEDTCYSFSGKCLCSPSLVRLPSGKLLQWMFSVIQHLRIFQLFTKVMITVKPGAILPNYSRVSGENYLCITEAFIPLPHPVSTEIC